MKKKIIASLLAACLFVGLAVPAFAMSSQSGVDEDITELAFPATSYTVKNGATKDLSLEVQAFATKKQLVQNPTIEWSIKNDDKFALTISDSGIVSADEDAGSATVTAKAKDGKIIKEVKVVAAKKDADKTVATSFAFKDASYTLLTGAAATAGKGDTVVIVPVGNTYFTLDQQVKLKDPSVLNSLKVGGVVPTAVAEADGSKVTYTYGNTAAGTKGTFVVTMTGATVAAGGTAVATLKINNELSIKSGELAANAADTVIAASFVTAYAGKTVKLNGANYVIKAASSPDDTITFEASETGVYDIPDATVIPVMTFSTTGNTPPSEATFKIAPTAGNTRGLAEIDEVNVIAPSSKAVEIAQFPTNYEASRFSRVKKAVSIGAKKAIIADKINAAGDLTIEVGQKASTKGLFKQGPSAANIEKAVSYGMDYYGDSSYNDYAELTGNSDDLSEVIGVAVGKNRITADIGGTPVSIVVTVVEKDSMPKPSDTKMTSTAHPKMVVGGTHNIKVTGTAADAKVEYKVLAGSEAYVKVDDKGVVTALKATPAGTIAKVYVTVDGKDVSLYTNITTTDLPTTTDPVKPTTPPATGV